MLCEGEIQIMGHSDIPRRSQLPFNTPCQILVLDLAALNAPGPYCATHISIHNRPNDYSPQIKWTERQDKNKMTSVIFSSAGRHGRLVSIGCLKCYMAYSCSGYRLGIGLCRFAAWFRISNLRSCGNLVIGDSWLSRSPQFSPLISSVRCISPDGGPNLGIPGWTRIVVEYVYSYMISDLSIWLSRNRGCVPHLTSRHKVIIPALGPNP